MFGTRRGLDASPEGKLKRKLMPIQRSPMSAARVATMRGEAMGVASKAMAQQVGVGYGKSRRQIENASPLDASPGNANPEYLQGGKQ